MVAAMYAMYQLPMSLERVGAAYRRTRQAVYDVFRSRGYKLRTKELAGLTIIDGHKFTLTKGGYLRGTVAGRRTTAQRYAWEKRNGAVPQGFVIHHVDGDKLNNDVGNLELVAMADMQRRFNPTGRNQFSIQKDNGGHFNKKTKERAHGEDTI